MNRSTVTTDEELTPIIAALEKQVTDDFRPTWGIAALLEQVAKGVTPDPRHFWLGVFDDADQAGALGYHDLTPEGLPVGKAFAKTDEQYHSSLSVTLSHELLEMLGDPYLNDCVIDPSSGRLYAKENADAVEADPLGYQIDGVLVSDFVLPQFFDPTHKGKGLALSHRGNVTEPFALAEGGYLSYLNLKNLQAGWQQETMQTAAPGMRPAGFPPGSRRERRTRLGHLQISAPTE